MGLFRQHQYAGSSGAGGIGGGPAAGGGTTFVPGEGFQIGHTFLVEGLIAVPVGEVGVIPMFFVPVKSTQTTKLIRCRHKISAGTSVTATLNRNGSAASGYSGMSITTTATDTDPSDITLSNNDTFQLVVTAVSGTPQNLSFTLVLEIEPL